MAVIEMYKSCFAGSYGDKIGDQWDKHSKKE